jgi:hypothetical protein
LLDSSKQWWYTVIKEQYELTVWFEDSCTTNLETKEETFTRTKKTFQMKGISKHTNNHIKGVDINGCAVEIKTVKPFDYHIVKIY